MSRIWKFGRDVDTDQIVPGRFAPYMRPDADVGTGPGVEAVGGRSDPGVRAVAQLAEGSPACATVVRPSMR